MMLLAQFVGVNIEHILIVAVVVACAVGVVFVVSRVAGVPVPGWIVTIFWIMLAGFLGILAIRFLFSL